MPTLQQQDKVIAILCSDIHISHKPPRARRNEPDWFKAMANSLKQLEAVAIRYKAPILCAGDVFNHWRVDPELINFAINYLPEMYAIPGQHDLPLHNPELLKRSVFWTMALIGRITPISHKKPISIENNIVVHGFPWGTKIEPYEKESNRYHIALCHEYFWTNTYHFPGAPKNQEASKYKDLIKGYHAVAFGDNHKGFLTEVNGIKVLNCGGFMRRTSDEEEYEPQIGLLCKSGHIIIHRLKTSHETFTSLEIEERGLRKMLKAHDMRDFLVGLNELQQKHFDFTLALEMAMEEKMVSNKVRKIVVQALEREE